jgi:F0F1-type ATP synthase assembly protein I
MKQTTAPKNPSAVFVNMALDMSWRLAFVVVVPVVAGFKVDQHFGTSPLATIVGFLLALAGMAAVLRRMLQEVASQDLSSLDADAATSEEATQHHTARATGKPAQAGKIKGHSL